jgi:hypothetical protein
MVGAVVVIVELREEPRNARGESLSPSACRRYRIWAYAGQHGGDRCVTAA